jgi:hypothetical protein
MAKDHGDATSRERQWKAHMEAWQSSDQTQQAFCKAHRLKYSAFCYWRRRLRALGAMKRPAPRQPSSFVPVVSKDIAAVRAEGLSARLPGDIELRGINEQNIHLVVRLVAGLR